jgi:predicted phage baseplate assembly protein
MGNAAARGRWVRNDGPETATNPLPATGGADAEDMGSAEQRAMGDLAQADRTVTAADIEQLALATPGVGLQRAHVSLGLHPGFPCVQVPSAVSVTVVPFADRSRATSNWTRTAPRPDAGALSAARSQLAFGRLVGQEVFVLPPVYRRVSVQVTVSQTSRGEIVTRRVEDALRHHLDPLVGGSDRQGWPFGGAVRPSELIGVVTSALGVESTVTDLRVALEDGPSTDCADLAIGSRDLVWLESVRVNPVSTVPTGGGLQ